MLANLQNCWELFKKQLAHFSNPTVANQWSSIMASWNQNTQVQQHHQQVNDKTPNPFLQGRK